MLDKKLEIIQATDSLINANGAKKVTIDIICSSISIAKKTFYKHFSNKRELLMDYIQFSFDSFVALIEEKTKDLSNPEQSLKTIYGMLVEGVLSYNPQVVEDLKVYYKESHNSRMEFNDKMSNIMASEIKKGQASGYFKAEINPNLVSRLLIREIESLWVRKQSISETELKKEQEDLLTILIRGMKN